MDAVTRGESPVMYDNTLEVNDEGFRNHQEESWPEILAWAVAAHQHLVEQIERRSEDELHSTGGWTGEQLLWRRIVGTAYIHAIQMHLCPLYCERGENEYAEPLQEEATQLLSVLDDSAAW